MKVRTKFYVLIVQFVVIWGFSYALSESVGLVDVYGIRFYPMVQTLRHSVFGVVPFSVGDVLYFMAGGWLVLTVVRWIQYVRKRNECKELLKGSVMNAANVLLLVYVLFLVGWGANYNKPPLAETWALKEVKYSNDAAQKEAYVKDLKWFARFLADSLNRYAAEYRQLTYEELNKRAVGYYGEYTQSKVQQSGLGVKKSMYGSLIQRMAVDGYYNPFTGEGQIAASVPMFMMPFTLCHEMAHQAGIAAEGDANLLAYAIGTTTTNATFRYSAYLNLWLYASRRLYYVDSTVAKEIGVRLPELTKAHIDTLEQLSKRYDGLLTRFTGTIYDSYLKSQHQQKGIRSYGNVLREAMLLEEKRGKGDVQTIELL